MRTLFLRSRDELLDRGCGDTSQRVRSRVCHGLRRRQTGAAQPAALRHCHAALPVLHPPAGIR